VPLSKTAVAVLRAHRIRQNEERLRLGDLWLDHDLVFPNRVGKPMDHGNLYYREYKPLLQKAGLGDESFTFHSLRHTGRDRTVHPAQAPEDHPVVARALFHHADNGHLLAPARRR
jgi:integrase